MTERFEFRYVGGHVEVYDGGGQFCFAADTWGEPKSLFLDMTPAA